MQIDIKTKDPIEFATVIDLDKKERLAWINFSPLQIDNNWYKIIIPCDRQNISDITIGDESIQHRLNAGKVTERGYEIWLHGDIAEYFSRISTCIAQDDLLRFKNLDKIYLFTESWNETVSGDFIPQSVVQFFSRGEGPHWYHRTDFHNLPFVEYKDSVESDFDLTDDLKFVDTKFYGQGKCKSLQRQPVLPTIKTEEIKNNKLRMTMQKFGFTDILQMQYVELQPNSVIPVHRDDFTYEDGRNIIDGPTQLYFLMSGDAKDVKFKFKNVGLIDVSRPIFINNHRFVHSLVYTGSKPRGVFLAYGKRNFKNI
jgi:hypothetical protein